MLKYASLIPYILYLLIRIHFSGKLTPYLNYKFKRQKKLHSLLYLKVERFLVDTLPQFT